MPRIAAWGLVVCTIASPLEAQYRRELSVGVFPRFTNGIAPTLGSLRESIPMQNASSSAWPILFSALLPGAGQAINGSSRAFAYLAIEAFAWTSFVEHRLSYRRHRDGYRALAARVARAPFSSERPNGDFAYYERMTHYRESGRYDVLANEGIQPETDASTYNGAVWELARRTYWANPEVAPAMTSAEWSRAMAFYQERAYDQLYRWSWTNAPAQYDEFRTLIGDSNESNRLAMIDLGFVIANHFLSTVDAYITLRLGREGTTGDFSFLASLPLGRANPKR